MNNVCSFIRKTVIKIYGKASESYQELLIICVKYINESDPVELFYTVLFSILGAPAENGIFHSFFRDESRPLESNFGDQHNVSNISCSNSRKEILSATQHSIKETVKYIKENVDKNKALGTQAIENYQYRNRNFIVVLNGAASYPGKQDDDITSRLNVEERREEEQLFAMNDKGYGNFKNHLANIGYGYTGFDSLHIFDKSMGGSNIQYGFCTLIAKRLNFNVSKCSTLAGLLTCCRIVIDDHEISRATYMIYFANQAQLLPCYSEMMNNQREQNILTPFGADVIIRKQTLVDKLYQSGKIDMIGVNQSSDHNKDIILPSKVEMYTQQPIAKHNGAQWNYVNVREEAFYFFELHARDANQTAPFGMSIKPRSFCLLRSNVVKGEYFVNALQACTARLIELGFTRIYELDNRIPTLVPIYLTSFIGRKDDIHRI